MRTKTLIATIILGLITAGICEGAGDPCVPANASIAQVRELPGLPGSGEVVSFAYIKGMPVVVVDGILWAQDSATCQWDFALDMYDPAFFKDGYVLRNGRWYRRLDSGKLVLLSTEFEDDFDIGSTVNDLILPDVSRYTSFVLQSPATPTVPEYNALRNCILAGKCDFIDSRIDFDPTGGRIGSQSLKFYSLAPTPEMITAKALVERGAFFFAKGDTAWVSAWYKSEGDLPFTILDLETSGIINGPGIRLTIRNGALGAELKWLDKPQYLQRPGAEIAFPTDQWVNVRLRVLFSEEELGEIDIWQNGIHIVSQKGRTLPTTESIIDRIQIGITATPRETTLHVDDVRVSRVPIAPRPPRRKR